MASDELVISRSLSQAHRHHHHHRVHVVQESVVVLFYCFNRFASCHFHTLLSLSLSLSARSRESVLVLFCVFVVVFLLAERNSRIGHVYVYFIIIINIICRAGKGRRMNERKNEQGFDNKN